MRLLVLLDLEAARGDFLHRVGRRRLLGPRSAFGLQPGSAVGLWAATNFNQITALFRVEQRSVAFAIASVANVVITVAATICASNSSAVCAAVAAEIQNFLEHAELDSIGIFGYSPEDGTEAINFENQINSEIIAQRVSELNMISEELMSQKAQSRIGQEVDFLVENIEDQEISGRIMQQGPEVDGISTILDSRLKIGEIVKAVVTGSSGPDLEVSRK